MKISTKISVGNILTILTLLISVTVFVVRAEEKITKIEDTIEKHLIPREVVNERFETLNKSIEVLTRAVDQNTAQLWKLLERF